MTSTLGRDHQPGPDGRRLHLDVLRLGQPRARSVRRGERADDRRRDDLLSTPDNCVAPIDTFASGLASGSSSGANDPVLFSGNGGAAPRAFWNIVDNNGSKHRD